MIKVFTFYIIKLFLVKKNILKEMNNYLTKEELDEGLNNLFKNNG